MPLVHDAVGINCEKGGTTEYQGADVRYLTRHDYPSLVEGESHGILSF